MAIEGSKFDPFNHSFSIIVECDTQAEIDRLWEVLLQGGVPNDAGGCGIVGVCAGRSPLVGWES
ncbi:VOC family protein [Paracoccus methylovorus]|uniref:VOC family protein n=1 Tax=Paracoccus methylovorus TaxID=2812658 RepID=A0ABX7JKL2_9RHOB|nr:MULTISPECIES: VOC family protein [Paracoccus]QRZ14785.1 VOC family protein [Paracoccus methylovorus]